MSRLRNITAADKSFLLNLYSGTRAAELATTGWTNEQKFLFLNSQFQLQHDYYQQQFPKAKFQIIEQNNFSVGRIYYGWENNNLRLIDIALIPEYRQKGIAKALMQELMAKVSERKGKLLLHVDINNPARNWYLRLGFLPESNDGILKGGIYQALYWESQ